VTVPPADERTQRIREAIKKRPPVELTTEANERRDSGLAALDSLLAELALARAVVEAAQRRLAIRGPLAETIKERTHAEQELDDALAAYRGRA
jgi:hypothetical protein